MGRERKRMEPRSLGTRDTAAVIGARGALLGFLRYFSILGAVGAGKTTLATSLSAGPPPGALR